VAFGAFIGLAASGLFILSSLIEIASARRIGSRSLGAIKES
jgi:hypothetical protein